ncbi:DUF4352 domain-containing protein [Listeria ilorinensis]|uniref:DUF4352 domain-containing protein n=1 Tax=Listeria ilorinensis TaxID=2867439 RepID=UPI001EF5994C|nr:DUF4352 domain-containing protein [Listeria ilorinensis]
MKKIILILMSVTIILGLSGCGGEFSVKESEEMQKIKADQQKREELNRMKSINYKVNEMASFKKLNIKVNNAQFSDQADSGGPSEGKEFVIVNITLSSDANVGLGYTPYDFKIIADENKSTPNLRPSNVKDLLVGGNLEKGHKSITGNLVGQIPKGAHSVKLEYVAAYWDNTPITFILK